MGQKAREWVRKHLASEIDPNTDHLMLESWESAGGTWTISIPVNDFADQFAGVIESTTKGKAAAMKAVQPTLPDDASDKDRERLLAAGLGFDKYLDDWKKRKLIP